MPINYNTYLEEMADLFESVETEASALARMHKVGKMSAPFKRPQGQKAPKQGEADDGFKKLSEISADLEGQKATRGKGLSSGYLSKAITVAEAFPTITALRKALKEADKSESTSNAYELASSSGDESPVKTTPRGAGIDAANKAIKTADGFKTKAQRKAYIEGMIATLQAAL